MDKKRSKPIGKMKKLRAGERRTTTKTTGGGRCKPSATLEQKLKRAKKTKRKRKRKKGTSGAGGRQMNKRQQQQHRLDKSKMTSLIASAAPMRRTKSTLGLGSPRAPFGAGRDKMGAAIAANWQKDDARTAATTTTGVGAVPAVGMSAQHQRPIRVAAAVELVRRDRRQPPLGPPRHSSRNIAQSGTNANGPSGPSSTQVHIRATSLLLNAARPAEKAMSAPTGLLEATLKQNLRCCRHATTCHLKSQHQSTNIATTSSAIIAADTKGQQPKAGPLCSLYRLTKTTRTIKLREFDLQLHQRQQPDRKRAKLSTPSKLSELLVAKVVERHSGPVASDGQAGRETSEQEKNIDHGHSNNEHSYLLHCRTSLKRREQPLAASTSIGGTRRPDEKTQTGSGLNKLRPPVRRLKSMPPSSQRATHTNNNRTAAASGRDYGSTCGDESAQRQATAANAGTRLVRTGQELARSLGAGGCSCNPAPVSANGLGDRQRVLARGHYMTRQRLAQANMARATYNAAGIMQPSSIYSLEPSSRGQINNLNHTRPEQSTNEMELIKASSRKHHWHWSETKKSHECVVSEDRLSVCIHPHCSESTSACRGAEPFKRNGNYYYWEIHVRDKIYGTSVMFGLCTGRQRMHADDYCNLVGLDNCGWSLSHKGLAWHNGVGVQYTNIFPMNQPVTVGLLYDTMRGELSFFKDGKNLGVAFKGLNEVKEDLYPIVASTAKCTQMTLMGTYCGFVSLLERSCFSLLTSTIAKNRDELIEYLRRQNLPKHLLQYVAQAANVGQGQVRGAGLCSSAPNRSHAQIKI